MLGRRLIPAHAGKTRSTREERERPRAHPRSRGENGERSVAETTARGSSPLTRGKLRERGHDEFAGGLIPAHAGKTFFLIGYPDGQPAHPRSRGENEQGAPDHVWPVGSSPLTRGKRPKVGDSVVAHRLIPAHAGKTAGPWTSSTQTAAHPRSRGENLDADCGVGFAAGSSPLTRGKHFLTCAFIAQIDQILESLELCASSGSYSLMDAYATDAPQDRVRSIGLAPLSSRGAS